MQSFPAEKNRRLINFPSLAGPNLVDKRTPVQPDDDFPVSVRRERGLVVVVCYHFFGENGRDISRVLDFRHIVVKCNTILKTLRSTKAESLFWLWTQKMPHSSPLYLYGRAMGCLFWVLWRKDTARFECPLYCKGCALEGYECVMWKTSKDNHRQVSWEWAVRVDCKWQRGDDLMV